MGQAIERIETRRLILRHFAQEDWRDLQEIAISKEQDDFSACDFAWPTDEEGVQAACAYFAADAANWAVALKETGKVICFVRQNGIEAGQEMDIGHLVNRAYAGQGYEEEALCALYRRVFSEMGVKAILARWAAADEEKLAPLKALGMRCVSVHMGDYFQPNAKGLTGQFAGATYRITKEKFAQRYGLRQ